MSIETPVALFVYNRTLHLPAIFRSIIAAKPPLVFVVADGARTDDLDRQQVAAVRRMVEEADWPCPVRRLYAETNLGCTRRFLTGIDQIFAETEQAVFVEDDVTVSNSFFRFCDALLGVYRGNPDIMMISGINALDEWPAGGASHFFSALGSAQAWASWSRAWSAVAEAHEAWSDAAVRARVRASLADDEQFAARDRIYRLPPDSPRNSWDYPWALARQMRGGLAAVPCKSLAVHGGHSPSSVHVQRANVVEALVRLHEAHFPLRCPDAIKPDRAYDRLLFEITNNLLSPDSALRIARMLMERDHRLLAMAILRHQFQDSWKEVAAGIGLAPIDD